MISICHLLCHHRTSQVANLTIRWRARSARYGKIGDWLEKLGFASEQEVTAALAVQWGCPLVSSFDLGIVDMPGSIPLPILESFQMLPANYTAATNTLYLAFGERVDHAALYTIERTLDCRTQPCVAQRRKIACRLDDLRQMPRPGDVEFVTRDFGEMARITSSYVNRVNPEQVRICRMGSFIWLRLKARAAATNLVFNLVPKRAPSRVGFLESSSLSLASLTYSTPSAPGASDEMPLPLGD